MSNYFLENEEMEVMGQKRVSWAQCRGKLHRARLIWAPKTLRIKNQEQDLITSDSQKCCSSPMTLNYRYLATVIWMRMILETK